MNPIFSFTQNRGLHIASFGGVNAYLRFLHHVSKSKDLPYIMLQNSCTGFPPVSLKDAAKTTTSAHTLPKSVAVT